jgi:hypothetical protein
MDSLGFTGFGILHKGWKWGGFTRLNVQREERERRRQEYTPGKQEHGDRRSTAGEQIAGEEEVVAGEGE